jgi:serine O-acetyltransferase
VTITEDLVHSVHQHISNLLENSFGLLMRFNKRGNYSWGSEVTRKSLEDFELNVAECQAKYYQNLEGEVFSATNSDHMAMLLYILSRNIYLKTNDSDLPDLLSYLNKILHGIDVWHTVQLPKNFFFVHPLGTVLGRASYGDFLVVYQNVTVGSSGNGVFPIFKGSCILYSNSAVIGKSFVGNNIIIGAKVLINSMSVADNLIVKLDSNNLNRIVKNRVNVRDFFLNSKA